MNRNNGMRAWRRAARKWRHKQNRRSGAPRADGSGRWYRRQRAWFRQRPAVPHRPFTPRSLVGMSQRRRKQLYHQLFDTQTDPETIYSGTWSRGGLHIGERLRPCRWCGGPEAFEACRGKRIAQEVVGAHRRGECVFCRTCADAKLTLRVPNPDACDGSGVLPAAERLADGGGR